MGTNMEGECSDCRCIGSLRRDESDPMWGWICERCACERASVAEGLARIYKSRAKSLRELFGKD